jgi:hypothetical protein
MPMNSTYRNAIADAGKALITHIGLVNSGGTELTGGSYARLAVTWTAASNGTVRPTANLTFDVPAGTVGGWRGYSALSSGTDYGGQTLTTETFAEAGQYTLLAASTGILHQDP